MPITPINTKFTIITCLLFLSFCFIWSLVHRHYLKSLSPTELEKYNRKKEKHKIEVEIQSLEEELLMLNEKSKEIESKKEELSRVLKTVRQSVTKYQ